MTSEPPAPADVEPREPKPFKDDCPRCDGLKSIQAKICMECYNLARMNLGKKTSSGRPVERKIPCPTCDGMMNWDSGHCRKCWPGRPKYHEYPPLRGENPHARKATADKKMSDKLAAEETAEKLSPAVTRLLNAALENDEMGGVQKDTEWVYQNLMVLWRFIDVDEIPSPGSLALLVEAKKDRRWFLSNYHAKLLAITSKIDPDGWFEADDNQIEDAAAECRQELARIAGEA